MAKEQSFSKLFRASRFAQFDPHIPRIYKACSPPTASIRKSTPAEERPAFFGFKRDLHPTHYGSKLEYVQMITLDGDYGQCDLRNAADKICMFTVVSELQRLLGFTGFEKKDKTNGGGVPQTIISDFSQRPCLFPNGVRIPGRVLNRLDNNGYAIGIGGVVAELPNSEIPPMQHFSQADIYARRAFYFYVKKAEIDNKGKPRVTVSLKSQ